MKKLLLIVVLASVLSFGWYRMSLRPVDANSEKRISVTIDAGSSLREIASLLHEKNLIRSQKAFEWYNRLHGTAGALQAGTFIVREDMPVADIVSVLQSGLAEEIILTIPEGYTVKDIDALLAEKGIITEGELVACAQTCDFSSFEFLPDSSDLAERGGAVEGYLYPDTYYVNTSEFVPKFFIERLMTTFRNKFLNPHQEDIETSGRTLHEIVTMASLIEEEAANNEERPMISGILWKRFDAGTGLGVDATVRYILDKPSDAITTADLNVNDPYNTRKFRGLPPGPIASPGLKSLEAALSPKESPYWYYLHGSDGVIRYAETNEEHNINKYQYIR